MPIKSPRSDPEKKSLDEIIKRRLRFLVDTFDVRPREREPTVANIVLIPGYRENAFLLMPLIVLLFKERYRIFGCDLPGHGTVIMSKRERGLVTRDELIETTRLMLLRMLRSRSGKGKKIFVIGRSTGVIGILRLLQLKPFYQKRIAGIVAASAPLVVDTSIRPFLKYFVKFRFFVRFFFWLSGRFPRLPVDIFIFTKKRRRMKPIDLANPLYYRGHIPASFAGMIYEESLKVRAEISKIKTPILFIHGTDDDTADFSGVVEAFSQIGSVEKALIPIPDGTHDIFDGSGTAEKYIIEWINERVKRNEPQTPGG